MTEFLTRDTFKVGLISEGTITVPDPLADTDAVNKAWALANPGPAGPPGGSYLNAQWNFNQTITVSPASGTMRMDATTYAAATTLWIHETDRDGLDRTAGLNTLTSDCQIIMQSPQGRAVWDVTSVADSGTYRTIGVTMLEQSGSRPGNSATTTIYIVPAGTMAIPAGGTAGQVLAKASSTNYDSAWTNPGGSFVPGTTAFKANNAEGGTNTTTVTAGNSGGASGDAWGNIDGTPTYTTTSPLAGALSYDLGTAASTGRSVNWTQSILGALPIHYGRMLYRLTALPTGASAHAVMGKDADSGNVIFRIGFGTVGEFRFGIGVAGNWNFNANANLSAGVAYRLEWKVDLAGGSAEIRAYIAATGVLHCSGSGTFTPQSSVQWLAFGRPATGSGVFTGQFDDIAISKTGWLSDQGGVGGLGLITGEEADERYAPLTRAVLAGGTTDQVLAKASGTDYDLKWSTPSGGGGSGHVIQDEGTPLTTRANLNFVGSGVAVTDDSGAGSTVVTISSGGGGMTQTEGDARYLQLSGGTLTGVVTGVTPTTDNHLATKAYVDSLIRPRALQENNAEGGTNTTAVSSTNSGGTSGDQFSGIVGTATTYTTTSPLRGSLSYDLGASGTSGVGVTWTTVALGLRPITYGRMMIRLTALPTSSTGLVVLTKNGDAGATVYRIGIGTNGAMRFGDASTYLLDSTALMSAATIYRMEWRVDSALGNMEIRLYSAANVLLSANTGTFTATSAMSWISFGRGSGGSGVFTGQMDELAIGAEGWLGVGPSSL